MVGSLRARLLMWYVLIVFAVIGAVGAAVCYMVWRTRLAEIDADLYARAETVSAAVRPGGGGAFDVELPSEATTYFQRPRTRPYYAVWNGTDELLDRSDPDLTLIKAPPPGSSTRGGRREVIVRRGSLTILVGRHIEDVRRELWSLAGTVTTVGVLGMALSLAGGWFLAGRALIPVRRMNETARRMAAGDLTARIPVERTETELGQVAIALNLAFDRLQSSIERQRRFTADASHELRTPVATLLAELDWATCRDRPACDYRESLETCRRAAVRMRGLVEGLLTLARADSGDLLVHRVPVSLDDVLAEALALLRPLANQRNIEVTWVPTGATVLADPARLLDLVGNVVANGIVHNRPGGAVAVSGTRDTDAVVLRVRDTGPGISAEDLPRIFDRFYRADAARTRAPGGAGLGLSLARWIAEQCGGRIECVTQPGRGSDFLVYLPLAGDHSEADVERPAPAGATNLGSRPA